MSFSKEIPVQISVWGAFVMVQYPYRKGKDLYVALEGHPVFCTQCEATFPLGELQEHVTRHDRRFK